jgi:chromosome segregation ATPase
MSTATGKTHCATCEKEKVAYKCEGCSQDFCLNHLNDHHQLLIQQLDDVDNQRNIFRQILTEQTKNLQKHFLIQQINQWENDSINKIKQTADVARQLILQHAGKHINRIEIRLTKLTEELKRIRKEDDFTEVHLNELKQKLKQLEEQLNNPPNVSIEQENSSSFINKISVLISSGKYNLLLERAMSELQSL